MNLYSLVGFTLAIGVLVGGLFLSSDDVAIFFDPISIFIVLGGTVAAASISFQLDRLVSLFKVFVIRVIKGAKTDYKAIIADIIQISEKYRTGVPAEQLMEECSDLFFKDALELIRDGIVDNKTINVVLAARADNIYQLYTQENEKFKALGKYPPAFGMMGTTIGMIVLLANLGGADAMKSIGPAMGVCLITTLYGVIVSNLAIIPIGENLEHSSKEAYLKNKIIIEGVRLMLKKTNPVVLAERLNAFLLPKDRLDWKEVLGK